MCRSSDVLCCKLKDQDQVGATLVDVPKRAKPNVARTASDSYRKVRGDKHFQVQYSL